MSGEGHSSYQTYIVYHFRAIERILPNLKQRPAHAWVVPFFLCLLVLITAFGTGVYIDGYGIHPPAYETITCPAPAHITSKGCYIAQVVAVTKSGTVTYTTEEVQTQGQVIVTKTTVTVTA